MYIHDDIDSMLKYIHESIKHDCERHIMLNRISLGLPPYPIDNMRGLSKPIILAAPPIDEMVESNVIPHINFKSSIIDEKKLKGFKEGTIFDWKKNYIFPIVSRGKSWFWLKMLLLERYYAEQKRILLTDMSNHNKPNLYGVIWWNRPMILYAVRKLKEYEIDKYSDDDDLELLYTACRVYYLEYGEDVTIWGETLSHFGRNYMGDLKISKWNVSYVTKEMCPNMSDDEIKYMNHMWNELFSDKPYTSDFNNNKPKNPWLERKTKRGK